MPNVRQLRPQTLATVIDYAKQKRDVTSGRALSRIASEIGHPISYSVLNDIGRNRYLHPLGPEQREALAQLAGLPRALIDQLAGARVLEPFELPEVAGELLPDQRKAILGVVHAFVRANQMLESASADVPEAALERNPGGAPPGESEEPDT